MPAELVQCPVCKWKNPVGREGCTNRLCERYRPDRSNPSQLVRAILAVGIFAVIVVLLIALFTPDACDAWRKKVAEQVTILEIAYPSMSFAEAERLAEAIVGPRPRGC